MKLAHTTTALDECASGLALIHIPGSTTTNGDLFA
jgi:hypothetical protein